MSWGRRGVFGLVGGAAVAAGLAALNRSVLLDDLPPTLPGAAVDWEWRGMRVRHTSLGEGRPLVLLHGIHAAASAFEFRGIFEPLAADHRVFALEWPGFGKSERPPVRYDAALYTDLLADFLRDVVGEPAVLVASSLSAAYAVAVAARGPMLVRGLVLLAPTDTTAPGPLGRALGQLLRLPLVGTAAFNGLVSHASIRWFLGRVYADRTLIDEPLVEQQWATAHQPNARLAPSAFIAGDLDLPFARASGRSRAPILAIRGDGPSLGPGATELDVRRLDPSARFETIEESGQLPHDEAPDDVIGLIRSWLLTLPG